MPEMHLRQPGFSPLMINVPHYIELSQLICNANQLTGFYMMGNIVVNGLSIQVSWIYADYLLKMKYNTKIEYIFIKAN